MTSFVKMVMAVSATVLVSTVAMAKDRMPIPTPKAPEMMTYDGLRGVQYCEVWLFTGTPTPASQGSISTPAP